MLSKSNKSPIYEHVNVYNSLIKGKKNIQKLDNEMKKWGWSSIEWGTTEQWRKKKRFPHPNNKSVRLHRWSNKQKKHIPYYVFNEDETILISDIDKQFVDVYKKR